MWWISPVTGVKSYIGKCSADSFTAKKFAKVDGDDTDRVLGDKAQMDFPTDLPCRKSILLFFQFISPPDKLLPEFLIPGIL